MQNRFIDDVTVYTEGSGEQTLLMLHGWPDSYRLWDSTVAALKDRFQCVRFSLPGFGDDQRTRRVARAVQCPTPPARIHWMQNYPYAMTWFGLAGGFKKAARVKPSCPVLFIYGERKPFMFHSPQWIEQINAKPGSKVQAFPTGHWVMLEQPQAFADCVRAWLSAA